MIQLSNSLGLIALLALPVILLLFIVRPKRRTVRVSSNRLWEEALRERRQRHGLLKLLRDLSLLLFLLSALSLALGLAGLNWTLPSTESNEIVVILDVSASMNARGPRRTTRMEEAVNQAADIINRLDRNGRLLLITSGRDAKILTTFNSDHNTLGRVLANVKATDEAGYPREAILLALSLLRNRENGKVIFITDGAFEPIADLEIPHIEYRLVGESGRNIAITRFDVRPEVGSEDRYQILISVRNYSNDNVTVPLRVSISETQLLQEQILLNSRQTKTLVFPVNLQLVGAATATIDVEDALMQDNSAYAMVARNEPLSVQLVSSGNIYLESALSALPDVTVTQSTHLSAEFFKEIGHRDIVVIDGLPAAELPSGSYLLINTLAQSLSITAVGQVSNPQVTGSSELFLTDVDLSGLKITQARKLVHAVESANLTPLFWSPESTLALASIVDNSRVVMLGFDLTDSNFPLLAAFPLFLGESLEWLRPSVHRHSQMQFSAGELVSLPQAADPSHITVQTPSGETLTVESLESTVQFRATSDAGHYRYTYGDSEYMFAVNLTDEEESDIDLRAGVSTQASSAPIASDVGHIELPLWPFLVLIAGLLLLLEWTIWCWKGANA